MLMTEPEQVVAGPAWLETFRREGRARFEKLGLPTVRDEDWRYTRLDGIRKGEFVTAQLVSAHDLGGVRALAPFAFEGLDAQRVVMINGVFSEELSEFDSAGDDAVVQTLAQAIEREPAMLENYLTHFSQEDDAFASLNSAMLNEGVVIHVPANVQVGRPIHLLNVTVASQVQTVAHHRCLVVAEAGSAVTVIEHYVALDGGDATNNVNSAGEKVGGVGGNVWGGGYFNNAVTQVFAKRDAKVEHYFVEQESDQAFNIQTLDIHQEQGSDVASHSALFGGALVRNNVHPVLDGEGTQCLINGLYVGSGTQQLDNAMRVEHAKPHGDSRQFYRGVLNDKAKAVFSGRIVVAKGADKTDAKQSNSNLLLSDHAQANTKPQLEIYADDVKCTHGATVGQIDEKAVFYLRSRGIDEATARGMLVYSFAAESLDRMALEPVRRKLAGALVEKMALGEVLSVVLGGED